MFVIPSIDILNGKCVQLINGKVETTEAFGTPDEYLRKWIAKGANVIHVIDLNAALNIGSNKQIIINLLKYKNVQFQVGGGIRTEEYACELIQKGANRVIIGTKALDISFLKKINQKIAKDKIMIALDTKSGRIVTNGWKKDTKVKYENGIEKIKKYAGSILTTDIKREGLLKGPNFEMLKNINNSNIPTYISGGFTTKKDIELAKKQGFSGVVIGRALYKKKLDLEDLW
jgi:phosphoribosylformimino-5-aminoimidazole carboxamide ribotide isomerase